MLNTIAIVGRLTREPELYTGKDEFRVVNFSLAFNQGTNPDGSENTGFIDCKSYSKLADSLAEWLSKGDKVAITGRLVEEKFLRKDGSKGSKHCIVVDGVEFIDILKNAADPEEPNVEEVPVEEPKPVAKTTRRSR